MSSKHAWQRLVSVAWLAAMLLVSPVAFAQFGPAGGGPPPGGAAPPPADPNAPQTHAAPGGDDLGILPTMEATLPPDPLAMPPKLRARLGTDADTESQIDLGQVVRRWYGPYYQEQSEKYRFRTLFPLWVDRELPGDKASLYSPLYFRRRSTNHDADIVFPLYWDMRDGESQTHVVGPVAWRRAPNETDNWVAPLVLQGTREDGAYLHIPPLLTFTRHDRVSGFNLVGPGYCSWTGGSSCSVKSAEDIDFGLAPFYFYGKNKKTEYELIPPLLHYYRYNDVGEKSLNIWGPMVWTANRKQDGFHVLPLFYHLWGEDEDHLTVLPFFHVGHKGPTEKLFVNPLYLTATGKEGEKTFATWGYARYRGRTELDMYTPFYWEYRDPDIGKETKLLVPFLYSSVSPRGRDFAFFPFAAHFDRYGVSKTTWVTPFFQHSHGLTGWETNIHPFLYLGRTQDSTHTVVFPFFWDFASPRSRQTVGFPFVWRFDDGDTVSQLVLNTYYQERKLRSGSDWQIHIFPAFSYGETPDGHWWKVLYGLAGYRRKGELVKMYAGWVPFTLSGEEP